MATEENSTTGVTYEDDFEGDAQESTKAPSRDDFENLSAQIIQKIKGGSAVITCETDFSTEEIYFYNISITWSAENKEYYFSRREKTDDPRFNVIGESHLRIERVQLEDAGEYLCTLVSENYENMIPVFIHHLKIFDSKSALTRDNSDLRPGETHHDYSMLAKAVVNETLSLPCQAWDLQKYFLKWEKKWGKNYKDLSGLESPSPLPPRLKLSIGLTLEIQKLQPQHNSSDISCKIEGYGTKTRLKRKKYEGRAKLTFPDLSSKEMTDQNDKCFFSPCGLNSHCEVKEDFAQCMCRENFKWNPPKCERDCPYGCYPYLACFNEKCKNLCESSCGRNAECIISRYKYGCTCLDGYFGNPYTECNQTKETYEISYPKIKKGCTSYEAFKNSNIILPCEIDGYDFMYMELSWSKKVQAYTSYRYTIDGEDPRIQLYVQYNLVIDNVKPEDSGYYFCIIRGSSLKNQLNYLLEISEDMGSVRKSNVEPFSTIIKAQIHTTVTLPCEGMYGQYAEGFFTLSGDEIKWIKSKTSNESEIEVSLSTSTSNTSIDSNTRLKVITGLNLEIKNVETEDVGTYTCTLTSHQTYPPKKTSISHDLTTLDPSSSNDPCIRSPCGRDSDCYPSKNRAICTCRMGYVRNDPICDKGCYGEECKMVACVNEHCKKLCQKLCGSNEECRIQEYQWICMCKNGYSRNNNNECVPDISDDSEISNISSCSSECWALIGVGLLFIVLIISLITLIMKKSRTRRKQRTANEDVTMSLLPNYISHHPEFFDAKWEFPRQRLMMNDIIGEGHFGRVFKAQASGLPGHDGLTTVAVKTLKPNATGSHLEDLLSQYKLLKELNHPNIIRLLGVCTKNGPFYVIMEYAENGCLSSYLRRVKTDNVTNEMGKVYTPISNRLSPKDILSFAWQIAKGMSYLAEQKLVHRDLAARNVLLTKDLKCKISDFGLTKDVYRDGIYVKKSKAEVPIKWMAVEFLFNDTYTTKSDVWSFGIVLWELITFGETPYPGLQIKEVYNHLIHGNRMEKPEGCSDEFYEIMLSCWKENPDDRPEFQNLANKLDDMLGSGIYYLESSYQDSLDYRVLA